MTYEETSPTHEFFGVTDPMGTANNPRKNGQSGNSFEIFHGDNVFHASDEERAKAGFLAKRITDSLAKIRKHVERKISNAFYQCGRKCNMTLNIAGETVTARYEKNESSGCHLEIIGQKVHGRFVIQNMPLKSGDTYDTKRFFVRSSDFEKGSVKELKSLAAKIDKLRIADVVSDIGRQRPSDFGIT
ncbi:MAG: hypothetical protein H6868_09565 [Rhodospirillales bacterium]|nr:hypothetical protein [Rhodospirillales bacterium]